MISQKSKPKHFGGGGGGGGGGKFYLVSFESNDGLSFLIQNMYSNVGSSVPTTQS